MKKNENKNEMMIIQGLKYSSIMEKINKNVPFSQRDETFDRIEKTHLVDSILILLESRARKKLHQQTKTSHNSILYSKRDINRHS